MKKVYCWPFSRIVLFPETHDKSMFVTLTHGGHLGFFEEGLVFPNPVSWLDRALVGMIGGLVLAQNTYK